MRLVAERMLTGLAVFWLTPLHTSLRQTLNALADLLRTDSEPLSYVFAAAVFAGVSAALYYLKCALQVRILFRMFDLLPSMSRPKMRISELCVCSLCARGSGLSVRALADTVV
jgi:hypothetical protein